jgi:hypothetical protein
MAAGDLVQKGTSVTVGFGSNTNAALIMQAVTESVGEADMKSIPGEQGADITNIFTNPRKRIRLTGVLVNTLTTELATIRALIIGSTLSVNSVNCMVIESPTIEFGAEESRVTLSVIKEDSMTYS